MQNRTVMKLCIALCAASFAGSAGGYIQATRNTNTTPPQTVVAQTHPFIKMPQKSVEITDTSINHEYIIKNSNGYVTVYVDAGNQTPVIYKKYDIPVSTLPQADRVELEKGIKKETLSEVIELIEDFSS